MNYKIKHWIETRGKIESKPNRLKQIVEVMAYIIIYLCVLGVSYFFMLATANYPY